MTATQLEAMIARSRPAWHDRAACATPAVAKMIAAGRADFFPHGRGAGVARDICAGCPVRVECLDWALDQGAWLQGIFGGTTQAERHRLLERAS